MEDIVKLLLVEQIKERKISIRNLHKQMDQICAKNPEYEWMSLSTLDRRMQEPLSIQDAELRLMQQAIEQILSHAQWIHVKRNITEGMRENYAYLIDDAVSNGFALHGNLNTEIDVTKDDIEFISQINAFLRSATPECIAYWEQILPCYLHLPDLAKASILCGSYIGHSKLRNELYNDKIKEFLNYFPLYWGIGDIAKLNNSSVAVLGEILLASTIGSIKPPEEYWTYAINKNSIPVFAETSVAPESKISEYAIKYKHSITDYQVSAQVFIHGLCFILFIDRMEWLLAYAASIFSYKVNQVDISYSIRREYHDRGCTGFRFSDPELDFLCELLYVIESET